MILNSPSIHFGIVHFRGIATKSPSFQNLLSKSQTYLGFNATQNQNYIVFKKVDLIGLTPTSSNTAQSLLVAIVNRLTDTVGSDKKIEAEVKYWGAFAFPTTRKIHKIIEIRFYKLLSVSEQSSEYSSVISPMDY